MTTTIVYKKTCSVIPLFLKRWVGLGYMKALMKDDCTVQSTLVGLCNDLVNIIVLHILYAYIFVG